METIELGGNIELVGFSDLGINLGELVVIKKIVGNYAKKMSERVGDFRRLTVTVKEVHRNPTTGSNKFELHGKLDTAGKPIVSEVIDYNLYFALDSVLKKLMNEIR